MMKIRARTSTRLQLVAGALVLLLGLGSLGARAAEEPRVVASEAIRNWQQMHRKFMLIDCRARLFFETAHIEGAVSIPVFELGYVALAKDVDMVLYCGGIDCNISRTGAKKLAERGYKRVWVMTEGLAGWEAKGYPVVKKGVEKTRYEKKQQ